MSEALWSSVTTTAGEEGFLADALGCGCVWQLTSVLNVGSASCLRIDLGSCLIHLEICCLA